MVNALEVARRTIIVLLCLPVLLLMYMCIRASFDMRGLTGFLILKDLGLPYLILISYTLFLRKATPQNVSILWPLLIVLLGSILITYVEFFLLASWMTAAEVGLKFPAYAAIGVVILAYASVVINLFIKKLFTPAFWFGTHPVEWNIGKSDKS